MTSGGKRAGIYLVIGKGWLSDHVGLVFPLSLFLGRFLDSIRLTIVSYATYVHPPAVLFLVIRSLG